MCLNIDSTRTKTAKKRRNPIGFVTRYKIVTVDIDEKGFPRIKSAIQSQHIWKPGVNQSTAGRTDLEVGQMTVNQGIHVYATLEAAQIWCRDKDFPSIIMAVRCKNSDLIAISDSVTSEEVYTKVTLEPKEHQRLRDKLVSVVLLNVRNSSYPIRSALGRPSQFGYRLTPETANIEPNPDPNAKAPATNVVF